MGRSLSGYRHQIIPRILRKQQTAEMVFLRLAVAVKLQADGAGFEHFRFVREVEDLFAVRGETNAVAFDKDFDLVSLALFFNLRTIAHRNDSIATMSIPDAPVVTEHQQWTFEAERIVACIRELFTQSRHG